MKSIIIIFTSLISFYSHAYIGYQYGNMTVGSGTNNSYNFGTHSFVIFKSESQKGMSLLKKVLTENALADQYEQRPKDLMPQTPDQNQQPLTTNEELPPPDPALNFNQPPPALANSELPQSIYLNEGQNPTTSTPAITMDSYEPEIEPESEFNLDLIGKKILVSLGSTENAFIDPISDCDACDPKPKSILTVEYNPPYWQDAREDSIWTKSKLVIGWGFKVTHYREGVDSTSISLPADFTFRHWLNSENLSYGQIAIAPIGFILGRESYSHLELGHLYQYAKSWMVTASLRSAQDGVNISGDVMSFKTFQANLGINYIY